MSATSARRFLAIRWRGFCGYSVTKSLLTTISAIGDAILGCYVVAWKRHMATTGKEPTQVDEVVELYKNIQGRN